MTKQRVGVIEGEQLTQMMGLEAPKLDVNLIAQPFAKESIEQLLGMVIAPRKTTVYSNCITNHLILECVIHTPFMVFAAVGEMIVGGVNLQ